MNPVAQSDGSDPLRAENPYRVTPSGTWYKTRCINHMPGIVRHLQSRRSLGTSREGWVTIQVRAPVAGRPEFACELKREQDHHRMKALVSSSRKYQLVLAKTKCSGS